MKKQRLISGIILLVIIGLVPFFRYLHRAFFEKHNLCYNDRGISFTINRRNEVINILILSPKDAKSVPPKLLDINNVIFPGYGIGPIRLGDEVGKVEDLWEGPLRKYEFKDSTIFLNQDKTVSLYFEKAKLEYIFIAERKFKTKEGLRVGSSEEEVIAEYGQPQIRSGIVLGSVSFLKSISVEIVNWILLSAILSLISIFMLKKFNRLYGLLMILVSYAFYLILKLGVFNVFRFGLAWLVDFLKMSLEVRMLGIYLSESLTGPLVLTGIWCGELISKKYLLPHFRKYILTGLFALLGGALSAALNTIYQMIMIGGFFPFSFLWSYRYLTAAIIIYIALVNFDRLFGIKRDYVMI